MARDGEDWYINSQYSKEALSQELAVPNQFYGFVLYNEEIIGIIRILLDELLNNFHYEKASKLHRIYLDQKVQGKGIGKQLLNFIENYVKKRGSKFLWLEAMKQQPQALNFYTKLGYKILDKYEYEKQLLFKKYRPMYALGKELS